MASPYGRNIFEFSYMQPTEPLLKSSFVVGVCFQFSIYSCIMSLLHFYPTHFCCIINMCIWYHYTFKILSMWSISKSRILSLPAKKSKLLGPSSKRLSRLPDLYASHSITTCCYHPPPLHHPLPSPPPPPPAPCVKYAGCSPLRALYCFPDFYCVNRLLHNTITISIRSTFTCNTILLTPSGNVLVHFVNF